MYLTYAEYQTYGGTLDETTFNQLEFEARSIVDWWTFNRLKAETTYPEAVKRCVFRLIQLISDKQKAMVVDTQDTSSSVQAGVTHESNDGVATDYNTMSAKDAVEAIQKEAETTVKMCLNGVKNSLGHNLLYRGIYPNE